MPALLVPLCLSAGDTVKVGFTLQLNQPLGDLKNDTNDKTGGGLGFVLPIRLGGGHALRPQLEVDVFRISDRGRYSDDYREEVNFTAARIGADYQYYVNGGTYRGFYLVAGLNVTRWGLHYMTSEHHGGSMTSTSDYERNSTNLGVDAGFGFQFTRWFGVELRATTAKYQGQEGQPLGAGMGVALQETDRNGSALKVSAVFAW